MERKEVMLPSLWQRLLNASIFSGLPALALRACLRHVQFGELCYRAPGAPALASADL